MRSLGERLQLLRRLTNLKCGPGAAVLPSEVTRIHMDFGLKIRTPHVGAKKFWKEYLPRLKYHNPAIPMIVNRHGQSNSTPVMTIYLRKAGAVASQEAPAQASSSRTGASKAQPPSDDERTVQIDMTDKNSAHLLDYFIAETGAVPLQPTKEEVAEMQSLEEMRKQAALDRERVGQLRAEKKREEDMLKRARAAGGAPETEEA